MLSISVSRSARWIALLPMAALYAFVYNPWTKFPYTFLIIIAAVFAWCLWQDGNLEGIGLDTKGSFIKLITRVVLLFIAIEAIMDFVVQPLVNKLTEEIVDYSTFSRLAHKTDKYFKYLLYTWISAAFGEEILFRGFLFRQLNVLLSGIKGKPLIIAILSSLLFALPHYYMGVGGLIITFLFGLVFAIVYIKSGYNLWVTILLHGLIDSLFLTLAWLGKLEYFEFANRLIWGY
jgi:membrane protease YdiL (CAAX protease family)